MKCYSQLVGPTAWCLLIAGVVFSAGVVGPPPPPRINVMTWNIYYGGGGAAMSLGSAIASARRTNFPQRATTIARSIQQHQPHIVCLQEVAYWRSRTMDFIDPDTLTEIDFYEILQSRLLARGLIYDIVGSVTTIEFDSVEITNGEPIAHRWVERIVMLAKRSSQLHVGDVRERHFDRTYSLGSPPLLLRFDRGWVSADITFKGRKARYVCTHLEALSNGVREDQAAELIDWLAGTNLPVVVMGDLNSPPAGGGGDAYQQFIDAGYADSWAANHPLFSGPTCCQSGNLKNNSSTLSARIDHILLRGALTPISSTRIGDRQADRTPDGLWPSDHAGVVARVRLN